MEINGIYFAKGEFYQIIRDIGGVWNDSKERPIVCLLKIDDTDIYWAIPMGNLNHRNEKAKERLNFYLNIEESDIRSCFLSYREDNNRYYFLYFWCYSNKRNLHW